MKKSSFCFLVAAIVLAVSVCTPQVMYASLPKVTYIKAERKNTYKTVTVNGKIASENTVIQTADQKFIVGEVLVQAGDTVKQGDRILRVDTVLTQQLYLSSGGYFGEKYITAAADGSVEYVFVANGMSVNENTQLISIIDTDSLCVQLTIGEDVISRIKTGQKITVTSNAFGDKTYNGKIKSIGAVATSQNSSVSVVNAKAELFNPDKSLKPGYSCKAKIVTDKIKKAVIIPSECVLQDEKGEFVYKLVKTKSKKEYVETADITKDGTVIKSGVKNGEYVISNPQTVNGNTLVAIKE